MYRPDPSQQQGSYTTYCDSMVSLKLAESAGMQ